MNYHNMLRSPRFGGAEKLAVEIHKYVAAQRPGKSKLLVPAGGDTETLARSERLDFQTFQLNWLLGPRRLPSLAANLDLLVKLRRRSQGVLHIHAPFMYGALQPFLAISGFKTVVHVHLDYSEEDLRWAFRRSPDVVIVCAKFMRERVAKLTTAHAGGGAEIVVAINAVDVERFAPGDRLQAKHDLGAPTDRPLFLMAANISPHKGQETAIRAVARLTARGYRPLLWLAGEERASGTAHTERLRALIAELGLSESVRLLGFRSDVEKLLHAADCLLLPSTQEGLPLTILEAQASRVVVVAAPTAGIPEVIDDGRTGFLVAADDPEGYATVLASLLDNRELAQSVAETAYRQVVSNNTLSQYCRNILSVYDRVLEER
ncbi:MAG: glycosyltransferase family 4 protein [Gemmataceae bacterium]|nr:glycosyltransferase family 4 protein [Gemmataceae bacterium]